jgi:hypothetical protein
MSKFKGSFIAMLAAVATLSALVLVGCGKGNDDDDTNVGSLVNAANEAWVGCDNYGCFGYVFRSNGDMMRVWYEEGIWYYRSGITYTVSGNTITTSECGGNPELLTYSISDNTLTLSQGIVSAAFTRTGGLTIINAGSYCNSGNPFDPNSPNFGIIDGQDYSRQLREYLTTHPNASESELIEFIMSINIMSCDKSAPNLSIVGSGENSNSPIVLKYDPLGNYKEGEREFTRLMGRSATLFMGVLEYDAGSNIKAELVDQSFNPVSYIGAMPSTPGTYAILYTATKPECDGIRPEKTVMRFISIEEYITADEARPVISLIGPNPAYVTQNAEYIDHGATVTPPDATNPVVWSNDVNTNVAGTYSVVYRSCRTLTYSNGNTENVCVTATRQVIVQEEIIGSLPTPVIILNTFAINVNGTVYNLRDTIFRSNQTVSLRDKGVKEAFYIKDGKKESIPTSRVTISAATGSGAERRITYTLEKTSDYERKVETRYGYVRDRECEFMIDPPTLDLRSVTGGSGSGDITITAGTTWDYDKSWNSTGMDESTQWGGGKLGIDFGTLNWGFPQAGNSEITYVAAGGCEESGFVIKKRTVRVTAP